MQHQSFPQSCEANREVVWYIQFGQIEAVNRSRVGQRWSEDVYIAKNSSKPTGEVWSIGEKIYAKKVENKYAA